jgi:hypothetical protein
MENAGVSEELSASIIRVFFRSMHPLQVTANVPTSPSHVTLKETLRNIGYYKSHSA